MREETIEQLSWLIDSKVIVAATDQTLALIRAKIGKGLLTDEELKRLGRTTCDGSMIHLAGAIAQAQLQKILSLLK